MTDKNANTPTTQADQGNDFSQQAEKPSGGFVSEYLDFLKTSKKWWLMPIIVCLVLLGIIVVLGSTGAAPFIYTLF